MFVSYCFQLERFLLISFALDCKIYHITSLRLLWQLHSLPAFSMDLNNTNNSSECNTVISKSMAKLYQNKRNKPVPSNFWLFTVATILNRECCTPSDDTQSIWTSLNNSYRSMTGPLSGVCFLFTTVLFGSINNKKEKKRII